MSVTKDHQLVVRASLYASANPSQIRLSAPVMIATSRERCVQRSSINEDNARDRLATPCL
jgi:hypothetical protein